MMGTMRVGTGTDANPARRAAVLLAALSGTALASLGVAFYRRPFATLRAARRAYLLASGVAEHWVHVRGLPMRYLDAGPRNGQVIILVHGLGDSAETWSGVVSPLARTHRVIVPDLVGFGRTIIPPEGMHFSVLADYFSALLAALPLDRAVVVGNSLGGAVAIRHAARHPEQVSRLFLLNTAGVPFGDVGIFNPKSRADASALIAVSGGALQRLPGFILDDLVRRTADPARRAFLASPEPTDVTDDLPRLAVPITIIWGERDRLIPISVAHLIRSFQPATEIITLPNAGHIPQGDAPNEVARLILGRLTDG